MFVLICLSRMRTRFQLYLSVVCAAGFVMGAQLYVASIASSKRTASRDILLSKKDIGKQCGKGEMKKGMMLKL